MKARILVVEDEDNLAQYIKSALKGLGYDVPAVASSGDEAVQKALEINPDLVIADIVLKGDVDGVEAARQIHARLDIPVIYLTSYADDKTLERAKITEPFGYLLKPFEKRELHTAIEIALYKHGMERRLKESERWLATTLRSIGDAVIATDTKGCIKFMNLIAETLTGWEQKEALGKDLEDVLNIISEETRTPTESPVMKAIREGVVIGLANHTILISKGGTETPIADSAAPIKDDRENTTGVVLVFRDITKQNQMEKALRRAHDELEIRVRERTRELAKANEALQAGIAERKRMERELLKAQKLESLGILAGGIAHDFNNLLTAILGNISLSKMYADPEDKLYERLSEAEKACARAGDLTAQLLTFSKGGAPVKKVTSSLGEIIKESADFTLRGSNVRCELYIEEGLWSVEIDEGQISRVISNLILNAGQAMPGGGVIKVRAENVTVGREAGIPLEEGRYVRITVEDKGIGIRKEHLPKVFDPYFTTKQKGSGLGLTTAYSMVKNHGGYMGVESEVGVGTKIHVYLPTTEKGVEKNGERVKIIKGKGRILVMDDEDVIREVAGEMLRRLGYEIEYARDGSEAIELYSRAREGGKPFDVLIMDLTVPGGMGGKQAIERLWNIDPGVKAIVSSGYSNDPVMADYRKYGFRGIIAKPYKIEELSAALYRVMNEE